jgi:predicted exporter
MRAHDPLGFLRHPSLDPLLDGAGEESSGFESPDGRGHLVFVEAPESVSDYQSAGVWLRKLRATLEDWRSGEAANVEFFLTGEPVFAAEIGGAMENDMRGTVGITSALIALLFWFAQRRLVLLGGLSVVLGMVFVSALGMAGWIYGEMSIMAAGFAAILIGLTVDYGVLICQEAKHAPGNRDALWKATGRSVMWASATTAVVFLALNRSGLPGIAQLGTMVACGIVAGAALMLGFYLPFVARAGAGRKVSKVDGSPVPAGSRSLWIGGALVVVSVAAVLWRGLPQVAFDPAMMRPRNSEAMAAFEKVQELFPRLGNDAVRLMVEAPDGETMKRRLANANEMLAGNPVVASHTLPVMWWPDGGRQDANRALLAGMAAEKERVLTESSDAGFTNEGLVLGAAVLDEMRRMVESEETVFPESPAAREIMRMFVAMDERGGGTMSAAIHTHEGVEPEGRDYGAFHQMSAPGISPAGWELLGPAVAPLVRKDLVEVFLPMAALMIGMLAWIFRSAREVLVCLGMMALSGLILLATMAMLGIQWNFLNIAATPLLLGTGIDYAIHIGLALRRNAGDLAAVWHGTGKAVLLCGASTAIGFGSLCFASNEAMASLGAVAVIGILACMLVGVFLLPAWLRGKPPTHLSNR